MSRGFKWPPDLDKIRDNCHIPDDVSLRVYPENLNFKLGQDLKDGEIIFSRKHLPVIRFPLHPLIHYYFYRHNLTPLQVNPNTLRILSSVLVLNIINGWDLNLSDVLYCYKTVLNNEDNDFYFLCTLPQRAIVSGNPSSDKHWKEQPIIVGGNWFAPELHYLPIRTSFGKLALSGPVTKLSEERVRFLRQSVLSLDPKPNTSTLLTNQNLLEVSRSRIGWESVNNPQVKKEPDPVVLAEDSSDDSSMSSESTELDLVSPMRKLPTAPLPSLKKNSAKNIETSRRAFQIPQRCEQFGHSKQKNICEDGQEWIPNLIKADGKKVTKADSIEDDPEVCLAIAKGIWTPQDAQKLIQHPASDLTSKSLIKFVEGLFSTLGLGKKIEANEIKIRELESDLKRAEEMVEEAKKIRLVEVETLQRKISSLEKARLKEREEIYKTFEKHVLIKSAEAFRCGWIESLKPVSQREYDNPDAFDIACHLSPGEYLKDGEGY